jgi:hypothetical protein
MRDEPTAEPAHCLIAVNAQSTSGGWPPGDRQRRLEKQARAVLEHPERIATHRARRAPVECANLLDRFEDCSRQRNAEPEIPVGALAERLVELADSSHEFRVEASQQCGGPKLVYSRYGRSSGLPGSSRLGRTLKSGSISKILEKYAAPPDGKPPTPLLIAGSVENE